MSIVCFQWVHSKGCSGVHQVAAVHESQVTEGRRRHHIRGSHQGPAAADRQNCGTDRCNCGTDRCNCGTD